MQQQSKKIPLAARSRIQHSIELLIELYIATEWADNAAQWQKTLDEFKTSSSAENPSVTPEKAKKALNGNYSSPVG